MTGLFSADTLKFEIFRVLHGTGGALSSDEIASQLGVAASAVTSCLRGDMLPKGHVRQDNLHRWSLREAIEGGTPHSEELAAQLVTAREHIETLQSRLASTQWKLEQAERAIEGLKTPEKVKALYEKVGLGPDCADHIFKAARRAHRRHNHPDRFPEEEKAAAHETFVELERVFDELVKLRK